MGRKFLLNLSIFCIVLSQGLASLLTENSGESSDLHIRKKRLIDSTQAHDLGIPIEKVPYAVRILKNAIFHCAGTLLLANIVLTSAFCLQEIAIYAVISGSSLTAYGNHHNITRRISHEDFNPHTLDYDLSMIKIHPPIFEKFSPNTHISVWETTLPPHPVGEVSGWGCVAKGPGTYKLFRDKLRSFKMSIIDSHTCRTLSGSEVPIRDYHICTYDPSERKRSCDRDGGDPLVVDEKLVGVMSYRENSPTAGNPQVFINLGYPRINEWIYKTKRCLRSSSPSWFRLCGIVRQR